ncbi:MAG: type 3 dihydrofolate reductase [Halofilum sp. (in: g-proteobacteria)]
MSHEISLVVAMDRNRVIGHRGGMPWHLPNDLAWFKRCTLGKPIVMGRKTWEAIGRALPQRQNIVLTTRDDYEAPGATVVRSLEAAMTAAGDAPEIAIIGGGVLFAETVVFANRMYLTVIDAECEGDTWFPCIETGEWQETFHESHAADEDNPLAHTFLIWERLQD